MSTPALCSSKRDANDVARELGPEGLRAEVERLTAAAPVCGGVAASCRSLAEWLNDPAVLNPPPRIPTTYQTLDHALEGGFVIGGLYLLVGLTGRGKSTLALNMARRMAGAGTRILLVSLEDAPAAAVRRMVAQEAKQPIRAVENLCRFNLDTRHVEAIHSAIGRLRNLPLDIEGETSDLPSLENLVRAQALAGVKAVILDQSSWVTVPNAQTFYQEASEVARRLKRLASVLKIVVVVLVQVNRAGAGAKSEGKDIELYHIRETGRWEQDCDGAFILQDINEDSDPAVLIVDLKKHRHGPRDLRSQLLFVLPQNLVEDDPKQLEPRKISESQAAEESGAKEAKTGDEWSIERFACEIIPAEWTRGTTIIEAGKKVNLNQRECFELLKGAKQLGLCQSRGGRAGSPKEYRRLPAALPPAQGE